MFKITLIFANSKSKTLTKIRIFNIIFFTDEKMFNLDGKVHTQNCSRWGTLNNFKVNV